MDDTVKATSEGRTRAAIEAGPYEDFREAYRERLRWLKETRGEAFTNALAQYEILVHSIAEGADPVRSWLQYGRRLGELSGAGKVYAIDASGRSLTPTGADGEMLLHLPDDVSVPALPLAVPRSISEHQKATLDLLVRRKLSLEERD
jgi:hypothetical protein